MRIAALSLVIAAGLAAPALAQSEVTPLVDAAWLIEHAGDENLVIVDVRDDIEGTDLGELPYIPNAVVAPYSTSGWRTEINGVPGMMPANDDIVALIESLGVDNDDHVVIVPWGTDSSEFAGATRVYWSFKYLGHEGVSILDGGWRQYDAAGGERVAEPAVAEASTFEIDVQEDLLSTTDEVVAALEAGTVLVDGRPATQYRGEAQSPVVAAAGTIPGAVNIENSRVFSSEFALFATPEEIEALIAEAGFASDEPTVVFCNTGHWASIVWFALSEVAGHESSMYDGSMAEWASDSSRPVEIPMV